LAGSKQKKKKKKTKLEDVQVEQKDKLLGLKLWNLRALVLKSYTNVSSMIMTRRSLIPLISRLVGS